MSLPSIPEDELRETIRHTMVGLTGKEPGEFAVGVWEKTIRQYAAKERIAERELLPHAEYCELNYAHVPVECNCGRNERIKQLKEES